MRSLLSVTFLAGLLVGTITCEPNPRASVSYTDAGLEFRVPDHNYRLVSLHYNINTPLPGVAASQYASDINTKTGNDFVLTNPSVHLQPGDKVNYWLVAILQNGQGYQTLDQSWTYSGAATTLPSSTSKTTTPTVTPAPNPGATHPTTSSPAVAHTTAPAHTTAHTTAPAHTTARSSGTGSVGTGTGTGCGFCNYGPGKGDGFMDDRTCNEFPCLIFEDNFDIINHKVWEHEITAGGGGNWEFQYYTNNRTNSYCKDGVLYIKPTLTADHFGNEFMEHGNLELWGSSAADVCTGNQFWGCQRTGQPGQIVNPIQSARLRSSRGFNFRYGKVEVEAKLPTGDWLWPAIWMLPRLNTYGQWPASGEIDIMESRGNLNYRNPQGVSLGTDCFGSTLHFGADFFTNQWPKAHKEFHTTSGTFADEFHKYGVVWSNTSITFQLDGQDVYIIEPGPGGFWEYGGLDQLHGFDNPWRDGTRMAPFDQEFYIILNVAVGGVGFFANENINSPNPKPWVDNAGHEADHFWSSRTQWYPTWHPDVNNGEDAALKVNYVKVWKMQPDP